MRWNPQSFDRIARAYETMASYERSPDFFLSHLPQRRQRALDVGCGTGMLTKELASRFQHVIGIDLSEQMLAVATGQGPASNVAYARMSAQQLAFGERFDLVATHSTLHHVSNISEVLQALRSLVAPGGILVAVDNTCETGKVRKRVLALSPLYEFKSTRSAHGVRAAMVLTWLRYSPSWVAHIASDTYLTRAQFEERYARELPGAEFVRLDPFMGAVWHAP